MVQFPWRTRTLIYNVHQLLLNLYHSIGTQIVRRCENATLCYMHHFYHVPENLVKIHWDSLCREEGSFAVSDFATCPWNCFACWTCNFQTAGAKRGTDPDVLEALQMKQQTEGKAQLDRVRTESEKLLADARETRQFLAVKGVSKMLCVAVEKLKVRILQWSWKVQHPCYMIGMLGICKDDS